jgi:hypothetical protein
VEEENGECLQMGVGFPFEIDVNVLKLHNDDG